MLGPTPPASGCPPEELLIELSQGGVSPSQRVELDAHLDACPECREVVAGLLRSGAAEDSTPAGSLVRGSLAGEVRAASSRVYRGTVVGRYLVLDRIGAGAMGVVYAAYDPELDRKICLKLLRPDRRPGAPDGRQRLLREAQAMARLTHPNVVTVHDVGTFEDEVFVAMELVEGGTLAAWLVERPRGWREVVRAFEAAGRGLAAAHSAGLVHRDFKPDNVLVGADGRIRVTDFGLARSDALAPAGEGTPGPGGGRPALPLALTRTGSVLGTPAYMAPEQLDRRADARSDQFNFCAALYEGLFGQRPFAGDTLDALSAEIRAGRLRPFPRRTKVPAWVRRLVVRGLSADPAERFPSMDALLEALGRDPGRRWRRIGLAAAAAVALGLLAFQLASSGSSMLCKGAERKLAGIWDGERQAAVRSAFVATGRPYAEPALRGVEAELEAYSRAWVAMHTDACEATRLRGEQSEQLLELRMACLERRRGELATLSALFAKADPALVERALQAAGALSAIGDCADVQRLSAPVPPPRDAQAKAEVERQRGQLAQAKVWLDAGRYGDGAARARAVVEAARSLRYRPLEAEGLFLLAQLQEKLGDAQGSVDSFRAAALAAEAGRHDFITARASTEIIFVLGVRQTRFDEAHQWASRAEAGLERLGGGDEKLEANLASNLGMALYQEGRYAEALERQQRALELREKLHGKKHLDVANALNGISVALSALGRHGEAEQLSRRCLSIREELVGPDHPLASSALTNLGVALTGQGRFAEALQAQRRSLAIKQATVGPTHPSIALALNNIAETLGSMGDPDAAIEPLEQAIALTRKRGGAPSAGLANLVNNLAVARLAQGNAAEALARSQEAAELFRQAEGAEHPDVAGALLTMGEALVALDRPKDAVERLERAVALRERAVGPKSPRLSEPLTSLGEAYLAAGAGERAIGSLERAAGLREPQGPALDAARTKYALAKALASSRRERSRATALAREAAELLRGEPSAKGKAMRARVDAWLGAN